MARPWRIQYEGAIYHIMSRGVGRGIIFLANEDYSKFLEYVEKAREKFGLDIFAFVLMRTYGATHIHKKRPRPSVYEECRRLYNESILATNNLAIINYFLFPSTSYLRTC